VYSAIFTPELKKQKETRAEIIAENSFEELEGLFCWDCAEKGQTVLTRKFHFPGRN
jgi:tRNA threonylcarbamoyladenosine biosynthesis protein TsaB